MAKYDKNALTPYHQRLANAYIRQLIRDPNTCEILRKKLKKLLKRNTGCTA